MSSRLKYNGASFGHSSGHLANINNLNTISCSNAQVSYLLRDPTSTYSRINKEFINQIELKDKPDSEYIGKMKGLHLDQLDKGLEDYQLKKYINNLEKEDFSRQYREKPLGILNYNKKQQDRRTEYYKKTLQKQEENLSHFIDADKIKQKKLQKYVEAQLDPTIMVKSQILYDKEKYRQEGEMRKQNMGILNEQNMRKMAQKVNRRTYDHDDQVQFEETVKNSRLRKITQDPNSQRKTLQERNQNNDNSLQKQEQNLTRRHAYKRHNPISNPIEYHIENPYILMRMQEKYRGTNHKNSSFN